MFTVHPFHHNQHTLIEQLITLIKQSQCSSNLTMKLVSVIYMVICLVDYFFSVSFSAMCISNSVSTPDIVHLSS